MLSVAFSKFLVCASIRYAVYCRSAKSRISVVFVFCESQVVACAVYTIFQEVQLVPLIGGIVMMLYYSKVQKNGMISLTGLICGILMLLTGMGYWSIIDVVPCAWCPG